MAEVTGVSIRTALQASASTLCRNHDGPVLFIHTFKRKGFDWLPVEHGVEFAEEFAAEVWLDHIQDILDRLPDRPDRLFVVINPYGGTRRADDVWASVAKPLFERAHITSDAFRTGFRDHAVQLLEQMPWEQFSQYDGIVAIGGDGLFQECLRGVLALRARGEQWRAKAKAMRIAQVPAGSTDAVACTINGCRSAVTAALHVVVGDRAAIDVLEVRTREGACRYACSTAAYGFIGDVLGRSESMRWMGPARYDVGGAMTFLRLQSYPVRLWYKPPATAHPVRRVCTSHCTLCSHPQSTTFDDELLPLAITEESETGGEDDDVTPPASDGHRRPPLPPAPPPPRLLGAMPSPLRRSMHMRSASGFGEHMLSAAAAAAAPAAAAPPPPEQLAPALSETAPSVGDAWFGDLSAGDSGSSTSSNEDSGWRCWEGEVASLMVVVTPTRSDKTKGGLVPHAHLSDGRLHLVIVRKCTRLQFLRFLVSLTRGGVDESLDFVEVKEVESFRLEELGAGRDSGGGAGAGASVWNVDGELVTTHHLSAKCHHGLLQVFGRGPEASA